MSDSQGVSLAHAPQVASLRPRTTLKSKFMVLVAVVSRRETACSLLPENQKGRPKMYFWIMALSSLLAIESVQPVTIESACCLQNRLQHTFRGVFSSADERRC